MNEIFKALSHPTRREIIGLLRDGPMASGDIAGLFDMSWPTITGHLNVLRDAGLVEVERLGVSMRYRLNISAIEDAVGFLMDVLGTGKARAGARLRPKRKGNVTP
ncbi:metalloregulator ArsR/SmtB family transcription factor [Aquabacterium sp. A7-Y]|uniref:metalloregulator ArsR/SmtB family transcription factor n=1 Tax=Aquabacterium sp. A7-Y TaxID=1349605 RepID=UPI00223D5F88|nr:metalloregulator ArsR/SmtB family transcription factor [Aquabacterium sp. A7-Y]MCW7540243.1 metalloregulator ArsR/SmtB family transcription factor [Aquabacterium sp. A7-Y]